MFRQDFYGFEFKLKFEVTWKKHVLCASIVFWSRLIVFWSCFEYALNHGITYQATCERRTITLAESHVEMARKSQGGYMKVTFCCSKRRERTNDAKRVWKIKSKKILLFPFPSFVRASLVVAGEIKQVDSLTVENPTFEKANSLLKKSVLKRQTVRLHVQKCTWWMSIISIMSIVWVPSRLRTNERSKTERKKFSAFCFSKPFPVVRSFA